MKSYLSKLINNALESFDGIDTIPDYQIEVPKEKSHGDLAVNVAMMLPKILKKPPRAIAEELIEKLEIDSSVIDAIEIAGPGFINVRFTHSCWIQQLEEVFKDGPGFGRSKQFYGNSVLIEFVSANPTGPLTVGHGRNAVLGDTVARLYEWNGAKVDREYYFNNAGRQMRVLGQSVQARYQQILGDDAKLPEGGYEGEYIADIAQSIYDQHGESWKEESHEPFKSFAEKEIFKLIEQTLQRMNINMDSFFNEHDLYEKGAIESTLNELRDKNLVYDEDGAVWFKTTEFGKDKDTVLVKSSGEPTYRLPDIAYHADKINRGYDICIDVFGADHIDTYPDVVNGVKSLGLDSDKIDVLVYQFVTLVKDGKPFKMSTRKANFVTLDELMDEVGEDVTRFFFLMRSPGTHLEFDIAQAKEASDKNPVFYFKYAHARIRSIIRKAEEQLDITQPADLSLLKEEQELSLIKTLMQFPDYVELACRTKEPHRLHTYLDLLGTEFTQFYHHCRVLGIEEKELSLSRVRLLEATAQVIKNALSILGIEAPERM
jgi:arginyl-tRNA synthetase